MTALHCATARGDLATVQLLVLHGADLTIVDKDGFTALNVAVANCRDPIAEFLSDSGAVIANDESLLPLATLEELHGRRFNLPDTLYAGDTPRWYIDPLTVHFDVEGSVHLAIARVCDGTWLGAPVTILLPHYGGHTDDARLHQQFRLCFAVEIRRWSPLNHPHVLHLFGAHHREDQLFFVTERVQGGSLREYLGRHPNEPWRIMHQVALAVQYLHERGVVHGCLRGDVILVTKSGSAKLAGMGTFSRLVPDYTDDDTPWRSADQILRREGDRSDDVYSLGMTIIEAITGEPPYSSFSPANHRGLSLREYIMRGMPPPRSEKFSDNGWDLVTRMIAINGLHRITIGDAVRELGELAAAEARGSEAADSTDVEVQLGMVMSLLSESTAELEVERQAFDRLHNLWQLCEDTASDVAVGRFKSMLIQLVQHLLTSVHDVSRRFAERRREDSMFSLHNDIDRLARTLHVEDAVPKSIHEWREHWYSQRQRRLHLFEATLTEDALLESNSDRCEELTCLYFELTRHRSSYASIRPQIFHAACRLIKRMPEIQVADWFVPPYEIDFDRSNEFNRGGCGSVHFGHWMNSRVVVKKVFAPDASLFQREVEIWYQLYHPHVIQLFGACHLDGHQFFACEVAGNGQLDLYLRRDTVVRHRVVWQRLYEAAMALQFLHYKGILHRDLKCNNILIATDGTTKLADFGLSSVAADAATTHAKGAVRWKAPEILKGEPASTASDVYGLAMCIVEAVTDYYPWGRSVDDEQVEWFVKNAKSMPRPDGMTDEHWEFFKRGNAMRRPTGFRDEQWRLVEMMTRFEASERVSLADALVKMATFAEEGARGEYEFDREDPEPEEEVVAFNASESSWSSSGVADSTT